MQFTEQQKEIRVTAQMTIEQYNQGLITLSEVTWKLVSLAQTDVEAFNLEFVPSENLI